MKRRALARARRTFAAIAPRGVLNLLDHESVRVVDDGRLNRLLGVLHIDEEAVDVVEAAHDHRRFGALLQRRDFLQRRGGVLQRLGVLQRPECVL